MAALRCLRPDRATGRAPAGKPVLCRRMGTAADEWLPTHVTVHVHGARGLRAKGRAGSSNPYAVIQLGKTKYRTAALEATTAPAWHEEVTFPLPARPRSGQGHELTLRVMHHSPAWGASDSFLGRAAISIGRLYEDKLMRNNKWFTLSSKPWKRKKHRGQIELSFLFFKMSGNLEAPVKKTSGSLSSIPEGKFFWKRGRIPFCSWRTKKNVLKYGEPSSSPCALDPEPSSSTCVPVRCPDPGAGTERPCSSGEGSLEGKAVSFGEEAEGKAAEVTGQDPGEGSSVRLVQRGRASAEAGQDGRTFPLRAGSSGSGRRRVFFSSGRLPFGRERAGEILGRRSLTTSPGASTCAAFPPVCLKDRQSRPREAASSMKRAWSCVSWGSCCPCL